MKTTRYLMLLVISSTVFSISPAHAIDIGKVIGLQSRGVLAQIGEVAGVYTGTPALVTGSVTADKTWGAIKSVSPQARRMDNRITRQTRQELGLEQRQRINRSIYHRPNSNNRRFRRNQNTYDNYRPRQRSIFNTPRVRYVPQASYNSLFRFR